MGNNRRFSIFLASSFILVSFSAPSSATSYLFQPPMLDAEESYIDITANSTLEINCEGKYPVYWKVPDKRTVPTNDSRLLITTLIDISKSTKKYKSKLVLQDVEYTDTGFYICYYEGTTDFRFQENVANITAMYVFVNDPDHLFVENYGTDIPSLAVLHQHSKGVISCRPTNSKANVTLWKMESLDTDVPGEMVSLNQDIIFDSTQGFNILYPTAYFFGMFRCTAVMENIVESKYFNIFYIRETLEPPHPHLDVSEALNPVVNGTFILKCIVNVEDGTNVFFQWNYPQKHDSRINETKPISRRKKIKQIYREEAMSYLIVQNAMLKDSGTYVCTVTDHSQKSGNAEVNILVYTSKQPSYVNLTTDIDLSQPVVRQAGQDVRFVITINVFPSISNTQFYWKKDDVILPNNTHYVEKQTNTSNILVIKKLSLLDAGVYTLFGKTVDTINSLSITLNVESIPNVHVKKKEALYMLGNQYVFECQTSGFPLPVIWWRWKPCRKIDDCKPDEPHSWRDIDENTILFNKENVTNKLNVAPNYSITSYLQVVANFSGYYLCISSNKMGKSEDYIPFLVTDAKQGFEISVSSRNPVDEDNVILMCKVNVYNFTHIIWKWKPMYMDGEVQPLENTTEISIYSQSSVYSHSSFVRFSPINCNDSGEYECTALDHIENKTRSQHVTINVMEIQKPILSRTNMNGKIFTPDRESTQEFYCYASGVPSPVINWKKNGLNFNVINMSGVEFIDNRQKLSIKRVVDNDVGLYECIVENRGGRIKVNATLQVYNDGKLSSKEVIGISLFVTIGTALSVLIFLYMKHLCKEKRKKKELEFISHTVFERGYVDIFNPNLPLEDQIDLLPYNHRWEFPKERLKLGKTLGQGAFGRVVKAEAVGIVKGEKSTTVAVKMLKETSDHEQKKALTAELKILIHLGSHLNIVNLLGAVTKNLAKGELMVIVEFCCHGNLRHYLLKHKCFYISQLDPQTGKLDPDISTLPGSPGINFRENVITYANVLGIGMDNPTYGNLSLKYVDLVHQDPTNDSGTGNSVTTTPTGSSVCEKCCGDSQFSVPNSSVSECSSEDRFKNHFITTCDLLCFAFQCARGMEYLISKKLIHRDLAARNVLLAENNVVKICDFGLAKDCYKYSNYIKKSDGLLPIKWMAIESIRDRVFTSKSDVWSFGILLWEIFTLGGNPYPGTDINEEFFKKLKNGYRMEKPEFAPNSIYELMKCCWLDEPSQRPDFSFLAEKIGALLATSVRKYYVELNEPYQVMNEVFLNNNDYMKMEGGSVDEYTIMQNSKEVGLTVNRAAGCQNTYDNITSIRPVGNGPIPKVPMEIVPMIQLDNLFCSDPALQDCKNFHAEKTGQVLNFSENSHPQHRDINDTDSEYLTMDISNNINNESYEDDVFLEQLKTKDSSYVNGFIEKLEASIVSTRC